MIRQRKNWWIGFHQKFKILLYKQHCYENEQTSYGLGENIQTGSKSHIWQRTCTQNTSRTLKIANWARRKAGRDWAKEWWDFSPHHPFLLPLPWSKSPWAWPPGLATVEKTLVMTLQGGRWGMAVGHWLTAAAAWAWTGNGWAGATGFKAALASQPNPRGSLESKQLLRGIAGVGGWGAYCLLREPSWAGSS